MAGNSLKFQVHFSSFHPATIDAKKLAFRTRHLFADNCESLLEISGRGGKKHECILINRSLPLVRTADLE